MSINDNDFFGAPWWLTISGASIPHWATDYTRSRSGLGYITPNAIIGRQDYQKYSLTTDNPNTVSGTTGTILV